MKVTIVTFRTRGLLDMPHKLRYVKLPGTLNLDFHFISTIPFCTDLLHQTLLQVTDQCALDRDQASMEKYLARSTNDAFAAAQLIYNQGGNSGSYAEIKLHAPIQVAIAPGTPMEGADDNGSGVVGEAYEYYPVNGSVVKFKYRTSDSAIDNVFCRVGALPDGEKRIDGCLKSSGIIIIGTYSYEYSYVPTKDNNNGRTIAGFSIDAIEKMRLYCEGCPYKDHLYFFNYYGVDDYGHKWVQAAFSGETTQFTRGNADFSLYTFPGRTEAIKKGAVFFNFFLNTIREFETSVHMCEQDCDQDACRYDAVHAWDEAVCFYTGSMEGPEGETGSGVLLHQLADKGCINFKTCGEGGDAASGKSKTNIELLNLMNAGKYQIQQKACSAAKETLRKITRLMYVAFIQGALRYAYKLDHGGKAEVTEAAKAEAAVFAAAILPRVHAADEDAAVTIYHNLKTGAVSTDFEAVKKAFESVYPKLEIGCHEVGGLWNDGIGTYYDGAEPCTDNVQIGKEIEDSELLKIFFLSIVGGVIFVGLLALCFSKRRKRQQSAAKIDLPEFEANEFNDEAESC